MAMHLGKKENNKAKERQNWNLTGAYFIMFNNRINSLHSQEKNSNKWEQTDRRASGISGLFPPHRGLSSPLQKEGFFDRYHILTQLEEHAWNSWLKNVNL